MDTLDLTKAEDVVKLMASSENETEWNSNCDKVKAANNNDYPSWWFNTIIRSGMAYKTMLDWKS